VVEGFSVVAVEADRGMQVDRCQRVHFGDLDEGQSGDVG
jgi:hypothetical protein